MRLIGHQAIRNSRRTDLSLSQSRNAYLKQIYPVILEKKMMKSPKSKQFNLYLGIFDSVHSNFEGINEVTFMGSIKIISGDYNNSKEGMNSINEDEKSTRKYSKISIKRRERLVQMIIESNFTIAKASKRLGIKASTARMILNKYKQTGQFPMKNFRASKKDHGKQPETHADEHLHSKFDESPLSRQGNNNNCLDVNQMWVDGIRVDQGVRAPFYIWVYPQNFSFPFYF